MYHIENGSIGRLFVTPPTFWNWQKNRKNVEIHPPLSKCFRHRCMFYCLYSAFLEFRHRCMFYCLYSAFLEFRHRCMFYCLYSAFLEFRHRCMFYCLYSAFLEFRHRCMFYCLYSAFLEFRHRCMFYCLYSAFLEFLAKIITKVVNCYISKNITLYWEDIGNHYVLV